ncbi:MAG: PaaI family thioesterase [Bernardetiaceae bacterium]|jgi:uncharacterized protein (TIGR00369 family)|nr:PaaI family thioesterase [Bernardetiaceae bacterium]
MTDFTRVHQEFAKQGLMRLFNAQLVSVAPGEVVIECPFAEALTQHHGYFHAGVLTTLADNACGFAALTHLPSQQTVLSVEFKINFLRPANVPRLIAVGQVLKAGKTLTVCEGYVYAPERQTLLAKMTATMVGVALA